ncbi:hypothetical protein HY626_01400 [Candidatus Uhrbacteria bacterium]|nr:hypothetical protein [Candidatus Uhrbacteria bacterium]
MSQILLYLPGNTRHSNVPAAKLRAYIENIRQWLAVLRAAGFPVSISFQRDDLDVFALTEGDFEGLELLSAPGNHFLPSRFEKHPRLADHARWLLQDNRVHGNVPGYFLPEFDIPRTNILPPGLQILFALPGHTLAYSEVGIGDVERASALENYKAVWFHDKLVVPMLGVKPMQDAFFYWQRFRTQENLDKLLTEIRKVAEDGRDDVLVFFLDLEAPLVGSHHGLAIWEELFAAIRNSDLAQHFIGFNEAVKIWQSQAVKIEGSTWTLFARNLGAKWTGLQPQLDYMDRVGLVQAPVNRWHHQVLAQSTTSDPLSAWDRKLRGPITITADQGPIQIGYNQGIIDIALLSLAAYQEGRHALRRHYQSIVDEDTRWLALRIADSIER